MRTGGGARGVARPVGRIVAALVVLALIQLGGLPAANASAAAPGRCPRFVAIGVRGSGDTSSDAAGLGATISAAVERFRHIARPDVRVIAIDYPSLGLDVGLANPGRFYDGVRSGVESLTQTVQTEEASCPRTPIVVLGYSQGAMVVNRALVALGDEEPRLLTRIAAVELIADPQRLGQAPYVRGTASQAYDGLGVYASRFAALGIGFPAGDLPPGIRTRTRSYCVAGDIVCAWHTTNTLSELLTSGTFAAVAHAHGAYVTNGYARRAGQNAARAAQHFAISTK
jgi:cutinase